MIDSLRERASEFRDFALTPLDSTPQAVPTELFGDLFDYRRRSPGLAWALWALAGPIGGHRIYLGRIPTAIAMMFTGGGFLVWWLVDAFFLMDMVREHNREQAVRQEAGEPPVGLEELDRLSPAALTERPDWADSRRSRVLGLVGDALVLTVVGLLLGASAASTGGARSVAAAAFLIVTLNLPAGLYGLRDAPLLGELLRWDIRLHAYYHANGPGSPVARLARPFVGAALAPFRPGAWTEVRLYLQLGVVFAAVFGLFDLVTQVLPPLLLRGELVNVAETWLTGTATTLVMVYAFVTPLGATLIKCSLLDRPRAEAWGMSLLTAVAVAAGLVMVALTPS